MARMLTDGAEPLTQVQTVIEREGIECYWRLWGRFVGAYTPQHYAQQAAKVGTYNDTAGAGTRMVPRERQREEIASDYYYGGMVVDRSGQLHPALYYGGLLKAAQRAGVRLCAQCDAEKIERTGPNSGGRVPRADQQGVDRGARGRDRDQWLYRRCDAHPQAAADTGGEPYHRHRGVARGSG